MISGSGPFVPQQARCALFYFFVLVLLLVVVVVVVVVVETSIWALFAK
jgi:hypothetical protein